MTMETREVVSAAVKLEEDGIEFYKSAAEKSSNELVKRMFSSLADDECNHIKWIQEQTTDEIDPGAASDKYRTLLRGVFRDAPAGVKEAAGHSESDLKAADLALEMEKKSVDAYAKWAQEAGSEDVKELCVKLADYERFHCKIIQNMIQYFKEPGDWFAEDEQWNFEGG